MSEKYMNGVGVRDRTDELIDTLFGRLCWCFAGFASTALIFGITLSWPVSLVLPISLLWLVPWLVSVVRLDMHIRRVNRETRKRGRGWIES